jgi:hypothetical protein
MSDVNYVLSRCSCDDETTIEIVRFGEKYERLFLGKYVDYTEQGEGEVFDKMIVAQVYYNFDPTLTKELEVANIMIYVF